MTSGCTAQACNLRDNYAELRAHGYEVIGVSVNDAKSHQKFIEKNELPFTLIADTDKKLVEQFGVVGEKVCTDVNIWVHSVQLSSLTKKA